jgi:hypothetical protein
MNIQPEIMSESLIIKQVELEKRYNELIDYASSLLTINEDEEKRINAAFEEIRKDFVLLYYTRQITHVLDKLNNDLITAGDDKHWRQFLLDDYITEQDPVLIMYSSWKEGILADILFNATLYTNRLNDSFLIYSNRNIDYSNHSAEYFQNSYILEVSGFFYSFNKISILYNEIAKAGRNFELSRISPDETEAQLKISYDALKAQEEIFYAIRDNYFAEAEIFLKIGSQYDEQNRIKKKAHDNTEQKRFEYEKQDAVQRWANTAYLGTDHINIESCKLNLSRAQTVLTVLSDLYSGETRRHYENPEYNALYSEYEQSFKRKLRTLEAVEAVLHTISQEIKTNEKMFHEYQKALHQLGYVDNEYSGYISSDSLSEWSLKDIITVIDGQLAFSKDSSMKLKGIDSEKAEALSLFFETKILPDGENYEISLFENSLKELSQRMSVYLSDNKKFEQWSLARDYLITSLIKANKDLNFLDGYFSGIGQMSRDGSLGSLVIKSGPLSGQNKLYSYFQNNPLFLEFDDIFYEAWIELSEEEKADLEFYLILTLSGIGNEYMSGFSQVFTLDVYKSAYDYVYSKYRQAVDELNKKWKSVIGGLLFPGAGTIRELGYREMKDINNLALNRIRPVLSETNKKIQDWITGLQRNILSIQNNAILYDESCKKLDELKGEKPNEEIIQWSDLHLALILTEKFNEEEIMELKSYWEKMLTETNRTFTNNTDALSGLFKWAKDTEEKINNY